MKRSRSPSVPPDVDSGYGTDMSSSDNVSGSSLADGDSGGSSTRSSASSGSGGPSSEISVACPDSPSGSPTDSPSGSPSGSSSGFSSGSSTSSARSSTSWTPLAHDGGVDFADPSCVEICCAPDSMLTRMFQKCGLRAHRLTLETGFDLSERDGQRARKFAKEVKAIVAWASPECKYFSKIQNLNMNQHGPAYCMRLRANRARSKVIVRNCVLVLLDTIRRGGRAYFEWPRTSQGWAIGPLHMFRRSAAALGSPLVFVDIAACAYGTRSVEDPSAYSPKVWRILTNDIEFGDAVGHRCPGGHRHVRLRGRETRPSAFYPRRMAQAVAQHVDGLFPR